MADAAPSPPIAGDAHARETQRNALFIVSLISFVSPMMLSAVNVAIPAITAALHADVLHASWIPTIYLLATAVFLLPCGKLADGYGQKRIFQLGLITITVASLLAACAQNITVLLILRVLQGAGAAMLFSTGTAIVTSLYPRERRGAAIGITVGAVYLGLTCGPLLGGWLTGAFGWRSVFVFHLPLTLIAIVLVVTRMRGEWVGALRGSFDLVGSGLYALSIIAVIYGLSRLPAIAGGAIFAGGVLGLLLFVRYERRHPNPVFEVNIFLNNQVFTFSCVAATLMYTSTFATPFLMSLYLQYVRGLTPQAAGMIMIAQPLVMTIGSPLAGRVADRSEPRVVASLGMGVTAVGLALLSTTGASTPLELVVAKLMVVGFGFALFATPNATAIMGSVDKRHYGSASGSMATVRVLGQMFSMGLVTLIFALTMGRIPMTPEHLPLLMKSVDTSFRTAALLGACGIYFSLSRGRLRA
jgi:EmrB/QacA subfamily drug resistance transporter